MQGYNGQIAVDAAHQIIVAHRLVTNAADARALVPLIDDVRAHLGRKPCEVSGDAGFANEANLSALAWVLHQGDFVVPIPGARKVRHLEENAAAADIILTPADLAAIEAAMPQTAISGSR